MFKHRCDDYFTVFIILLSVICSNTGFGQSTLGGGLSLGGLVSTSVPASSAPVPSLGLGGVDFSTSSEKNNDKSSSTRPEYETQLKTTFDV